MLKLFYAPGACSLASHIALEEAGADYQAERVDLRGGAQRTAAYLAINPKGRVPALRTDRGVLTENPVILGYIAQTHPDARLAPNDDSFAFGDMQAFNLFLATSVHVAFAHVFRPERYAEGEEAAKAMRAKAPQALAAYFALIEEKLADGRPFVHGAAYTVSDPYLFVFERWLDTRRLDGRALGALADFPHVAAHHARLAERPAVVATLAAEAAPTPAG
ncbi:MAG: glutathione S-transferase N-terminal domain-containing protein [Caulobacteraceae bacterium]